MSDVGRQMPKEYYDQFDKLLGFMYPQVPGAHFNATDSKDSEGVTGKPIGPLHEQFL